MGAVQIDIYKQDRNYQNTSLSSEEDVLNTLFIIDAIREDAHNGNHEALVVLLDFENLFLKNEVCNEYYKIVTGYRGYSLNDYGKDILDLISERLNLTKEECKEILHKSITNIVNDNLELWSNWANIYFKGKCKVKNYSSFPESRIDNSKYYFSDYYSKHIYSNKQYEEYNYPNDLQELLNAQKSNKQKIVELDKLKKSKSISKEKAEELRKRNSFDISLSKDIIILKKHYDIEIKNNNNKGSTGVVSLLDNDIDIIEYNYADSILDELQIEKIKEIAKAILTDKQLVIFNLYYMSGMNQKQIAELIGETKGNISRDLKISLDKIRNNL